LYDILSTFAILDVTSIFFVIERASNFSVDKLAVSLGLSDGRDDGDGGPGSDDDDDDVDDGDDDDPGRDPGRDDDDDEAGIVEAFTDTGAFIVTFG
jgi:hypothetical protein